MKRKDNELVLVDIDSGDVKIPDSFNLRPFPSAHLNVFKLKLNEIDFNFVQNQKLTR